MQTKKMLARFAVLQIALLFWCLSAVPAKATSSLVVTVGENKKLSSNGQLIFDENNIGPGFSNEYTVDFINQYKEDVRIYIEAITVDTTAPNAEHFRFGFRGSDREISGGIDDFKAPYSSVLTVPAKTTKALNVDFGLLSSAGNEYQNTKSTFYVTFRIVSDDSDIDEPIGGKDDGKDDGKGKDTGKTGNSKTGDNSRAWLWTGLSFISMLMVFLFFKTQRERKETEYE